MRIDVNCFVGAYPFRRVPGTSAESVLRACDRVGIDQAWISHLPSVFWRDPGAGNAWLYETAKRQERFRPIPAIHPGLAGWAEAVEAAAREAAPAVRCDPMYYGVDPTGAELNALLGACAEAGLPLMLAVRLEDARQRHPNDRAGELPPWSVRSLVRSHPAARLIVTHADRSFVEEVHFGSTPEEAGRIWWDICWIWGPPEDHLELLVGTVGVERFLFGTGQPLRIPESTVAKLDLLNVTSDQRMLIESRNAETVSAMPSGSPR
jgi:predicted TIM-barrel fold metal-dependent hydrolase